MDASPKNILINHAWQLFFYSAGMTVFRRHFYNRAMPVTATAQGAAASTPPHAPIPTNTVTKHPRIPTNTVTNTRAHPTAPHTRPHTTHTIRGCSHGVVGVHGCECGVVLTVLMVVGAGFVFHGVGGGCGGGSHSGGSYGVGGGCGGCFSRWYPGGGGSHGVTTCTAYHPPATAPRSQLRRMRPSGCRRVLPPRPATSSACRVRLPCSDAPLPPVQFVDTRPRARMMGSRTPPHSCIHINTFACQGAKAWAAYSLLLAC